MIERDANLFEENATVLERLVVILISIGIVERDWNVPGKREIARTKR